MTREEVYGVMESSTHAREIRTDVGQLAKAETIR